MRELYAETVRKYSYRLVGTHKLADCVSMVRVSQTTNRKMVKLLGTYIFHAKATLR